jgi:hypothetical protein
VVRDGAWSTRPGEERCQEAAYRELWASLELGLWSAEDALCLLHLGAAVAGVVHLQTVIQFIQILFYLPNLLPGYMLQPEAYLTWKKDLSV